MKPLVIFDHFTVIFAHSTTSSSQIDLDLTPFHLEFSVFANRVNPNIAGATISGIFMTMPLGFDVRCIYDDNFDLTIDDIYIDSDQVDMGDEDGAIEGDGDVSYSK